MSRAIRVVAVSGDLGSGKSAVSMALAAQLGVRRISTGDLQRRIAADLGMSTLELNRYAETHREIDDRIDSTLAALADTDEPLVVDSRLAWHFLPHSTRVHLVVDPLVAARRVTGRGPGPSESYGSEDEAVQHLRARAQSERRRFQGLYGVDIARLRNYDLVVDTTGAGVEEIVGAVTAMLRRTAPETGPRPLLQLFPRRILPTEPDIRVVARAPAAALRQEMARRGFDAAHPLAVVHVDGHLYVVDGHRRLSAALAAGLALVPAGLLAEGEEEAVAGCSARSYVAASVARASLHDWEEAHGFTFSSYPAASDPAAR